MKCKEKATEKQINYYSFLLHSIFGIPDLVLEKKWRKYCKKHKIIVKSLKEKTPKELVLYQKTFKKFPNERKLKKIDKKLMCQLISEAFEYHKNKVDENIDEFMDVFYQLD